MWMPVLPGTFSGTNLSTFRLQEQQNLVSLVLVVRMSPKAT
jgi:hypothetical protein